MGDQQERVTIDGKEYVLASPSAVPKYQGLYSMGGKWYRIEDGQATVVPMSAWQKTSGPMKIVAIFGVLLAGFGLLSIFLTDDDESGSSSSSSSSSEMVEPETVEAESDLSGSMTLSEAFCSDLKSGLTPMNILGGMVKDGTYTPEEAADRAYGFAAISCPEQLKTNESLRAYLESWNINPDA